jgi:hypothetical protein
VFGMARDIGPLAVSMVAYRIGALLVVS